jgi:hypothetical protein
VDFWSTKNSVETIMDLCIATKYSPRENIMKSIKRFFRGWVISVMEARQRQAEQIIKQHSLAL